MKILNLQFERYIKLNNDHYNNLYNLTPPYNYIKQQLYWTLFTPLIPEIHSNTRNEMNTDAINSNNS